MLTIYRRHTKRCAHRQEGRKYRRCRCPIWLDGSLAGKEVRRTTGLKNWEKAQALVREWEAEDSVAESPTEVTLESAVDDFVADLERRKLASETIRKYRFLFRRMQEFAQSQGIRFLKEFDVATTRKFCATWTEGGLTSLKKLARLKSFLKHSLECGWIDENPARKIKKPTVTQNPTLPYTKEEMIRILAACAESKDCYGRKGQWNAKRLRALVLLLRYAGLRISDAVTLPKDRIVKGKLLLYTHKTGVPVYLPLPDFVVKELDDLRSVSEHFYFWSGISTKESVAGNYRRYLQGVFRSAGIHKGHPHRFRDTFAVELLVSGVPLERVSVLLGHRSIKVTERHYAPWVRARQEQLEADVRRSWRRDPVVFAATKGTPEVHEKEGVVN